MAIPFWPRNPGVSASFPEAKFSSSAGRPPNSSPCPRPPLNPAAPPTCDYSFKRLVPLLESPPVGAGILAFAVFFLLAFLSDPLLANITPRTLGIGVTLSTLGIMGLIIFILFLL